MWYPLALSNSAELRSSKLLFHHNSLDAAAPLKVLYELTALPSLAATTPVAWKTFVTRKSTAYAISLCDSIVVFIGLLVSEYTRPTVIGACGRMFAKFIVKHLAAPHAVVLGVAKYP